MSRWPLPLAVALACITSLRAADKPAADVAAVMRYAELLKDESAVVRKRAAIALGRLGEKARAALPALEKALIDKDKGVRQAVAEALESIDPRTEGGADRPGAVAPPAKPDARRGELGTFRAAKKGEPGLLVRGTEGAGGKVVWRRVPGGDPVSSGDHLMSLPGMASTLRLDGGVDVVLRGHVREFSLHPLMDFLQESAVVLHRPPAGIDVDLTLDRGRISFANRKGKGAAVVRLRFGTEAWDVTLNEPGTRVGVDLIRHYTADNDPRSGAEPRMELYLCVLAGSAAVKVPPGQTYTLTPAPGPALMLWANQGTGVEGPLPLKETPKVWTKVPPATEDAQQMAEALQRLGKRLVGGKSMTAAVAAGLAAGQWADRLAALYALEALDQPGRLLDVLGDEMPAHERDREAAVRGLRHWLARAPGQARRLYDAKTREGLLADRKYSDVEARTLLELLHTFGAADRRRPETFELLAGQLANKRVAIAELAWWQLARLAGGVTLPAFNAAAPRVARRKVAGEVMRLINDRKLPSKKNERSR